MCLFLYSVVCTIKNGKHFLGLEKELCNVYQKLLTQRVHFYLNNQIRPSHLGSLVWSWLSRAVREKYPAFQMISIVELPNYRNSQQRPGKSTTAELAESQVFWKSFIFLISRFFFNLVLLNRKYLPCGGVTFIQTSDYINIIIFLVLQSDAFVQLRRAYITITTC